jgi:hypothetical protein
MWTDLFWREEGIWIANADKTLTPLYPFNNKGHYDTIEDLINNFNNIQNKFTSEFIEKYKNISFSGYIVTGAYWVDIQDKERTIYFIDNITDKDIYIRNIFTNETRTIDVDNFLDCHMPLGLEFKFYNHSLQYYLTYSNDNINFLTQNQIDINEFIDTKSDIAVSVENINGIAINENPVPLTELNNYYMNNNAIITTKIFNTSLFELGKAYMLRYSDGKEYIENYEAILVNISEKELVFTSYNAKDKTLQPVAIGVRYMRENENGEGWDVWKMNG